MRLLFCLSLFLATPALAETAEPTVPMRPGDPHGAAPLWDGVAECASILAAASSRATSRIDRDNLQAAAGTWFAATFTLAAAEGAEPSPEDLGETVAGWAGKIGGLSALDRMPDWMAYCNHVGGQNALDTRVFASRVVLTEEVADDSAEGGVATN